MDNYLNNMVDLSNILVMTKYLNNKYLLFINTAPL